LAFSGPETVNLELTLRCNLKCGMCQRSSGDFKLPAVTDMPVALVERALPLMTDARYVWLSGFGEPLMHPELATIIKKVRAVNKKAEIAFTTNFVLMTGQKLADIVSSGLSLIQVSMDGDNELGHSFAPTPEGVARYQDRLWKNLRAFHAEKLRQGAAGPKLQFCFVGMKRNISQLEGIIKRGLEVGLTSIVVQPVRDYNGTMAGEDLFVNRAYALPIIDRARDYARQNGVEFICRFMSEKLTVARQKCAFPKVFLHVAVNGHVYMCCEGIAADQNIGVTDPVAIWNSEPYRQLRRELATGKMRKKCWDCPLIKPAAVVNDALKAGLLELTQEELAGEVMSHRSYVDGCHEREEALARKCAALEGAQGKHDKLLLAYKDVINNINRTETALSPLAQAARSRRSSGLLPRQCMPFLDTLPPLLGSLRSSQESFPGLRGPAKDILSSAQNMGRILQPLALCGDPGTASRIVSGQLVPALDGFSGLFKECRNELNQSMETTVKCL
jgi:MoaA/NifB/PqqE/SkfB family radical SAM enzyme